MDEYLMDTPRQAGRWSPPGGSRWKLTLQRALLSVLAFLGAALAAEAALRLGGLAPPPLPSADSMSTGAWPGPLNDMGIRASWQAVPARESGELRIVILGDSFAYGEGVEWWETLPSSLEAILTDRYPEGRFRVFNLGRPGDDTRMAVNRYAKVHEVLDPDVLILLAYLNDFSSHYPAEALARIYEVAGLFGALGRHSYLVGHLDTRYRLAVMRHRILNDYWGRILRDLEGDFPRFARPLTELAAFAEGRGVQFKLALFPWLVSLDGDYPLLPVHERVARFAAATGIEYLDLLPVFRGHDGNDLRLTPANEHPNPKALFMAAEAMADFLALGSSLRVAR